MSSNEIICEFLGWYCGDGCISVNNRYAEFALTGDVKEEYPFYKTIIVPTFNKVFAHELRKPSILKRYKKVGVCGIYVFDKSFVKLLQTKFYLKSGKKTAIGVPPIVQTDEDKKHFLRGLCDTDGSIYFCKSNFKTKRTSLFTVFHYKPKIKIATISQVLIKQVYEMLVSLGFHPRLSKPLEQRTNEYPMYSVVLDKKGDVRKWITEIGFQSQKHLTKIGLWKKFGFCPPHTSLKKRTDMLHRRLDPLEFYPDYRNLSTTRIKKILTKFSCVERGSYK